MLIRSRAALVWWDQHNLSTKFTRLQRQACLAISAEGGKDDVLCNLHNEWWQPIVFDRSKLLDMSLNHKPTKIIHQINFKYFVPSREV